MRDPARIRVWSDIGCPWAHLAVHRLHAARERLGLAGRVVFEHQPFPLELVNERPTPWRGLHAELPVVAALDPAAVWGTWPRPPWEWPVTTLPALEAVQAVAAGQGLGAAEQLDRALRVAFFGTGRCISLRHVVLDVARKCADVDVDALERALDTGVARAAVIGAWRAAAVEGVQGSPHVFLPGGGDEFNPGVTLRWHGPDGRGYPLVERDDPAAYDRLLQRAAGGA